MFKDHINNKNMYVLKIKLLEGFFISSTAFNLAFRYDPMGNRIAKIQKLHTALADSTKWTITWYARDAQGNVLTVYNKPENSLVFSATEFNIYGSSRIGMVTHPEQLEELLQVPVAHSQTLGYKVYEFSNHLGNVLTTFSDRKIATESASGYVAYYTAEILSSTDYYPFGFEMPGRVYEGDGYRYGFQGQEDDPEVHGSKSTSIYFKYRIHDTRIGRFLSVDPLSASYPYNSSYAFSENVVINAVELEGLERYQVVKTIFDNGGYDITLTVTDDEKVKSRTGMIVNYIVTKPDGSINDYTRATFEPTEQGIMMLYDLRAGKDPWGRPSFDLSNGNKSLWLYAFNYSFSITTTQAEFTVTNSSYTLSATTPQQNFGISQTTPDVQSMNQIQTLAQNFQSGMISNIQVQVSTNRTLTESSNPEYQRLLQLSNQMREDQLVNALVSAGIPRNQITTLPFVYGTTFDSNVSYTSTTRQVVDNATSTRTDGRQTGRSRNYTDQIHQNNPSR